MRACEHGLQQFYNYIRLLGVNIEKPDLVQATDAETMAAPPVAVKASTEDMEMVSRTASSVSMASQGSEDSVGMQCTDTMPDSQQAQLPKKAAAAISEADSSRPSNKSRKNKKDEKSHEEASAMDVEPPAPKVDVAKATEKDIPAVTCRSAVTVEVFSGVGRTLSESGIVGR